MPSSRCHLVHRVVWVSAVVVGVWGVWWAGLADVDAPFFGCVDVGQVLLGCPAFAGWVPVSCVGGLAVSAVGVPC